MSFETYFQIFTKIVNQYQTPEEISALNPTDLDSFHSHLFQLSLQHLHLPVMGGFAGWKLVPLQFRRGPGPWFGLALGIALGNSLSHRYINESYLEDWLKLHDSELGANARYQLCKYASSSSLAQKYPYTQSDSLVIATMMSRQSSPPNRSLPNIFLPNHSLPDISPSEFMSNDFNRIPSDIDPSEVMLDDIPNIIDDTTRKSFSKKW